MKKLMIMTVMMVSVIAMGAYAVQPGDFQKKYVPPKVIGSTSLHSFECVPQNLFSETASVFKFYAVHPSPRTFLLDLRGDLKASGTLGSFGQIIAWIKQKDADTISEKVTCSEEGGVEFKCTVEYTSNNIPIDVRLRSELGCGYTDYVALTYSSPEGTYGVEDSDGDGVNDSDENCTEPTPFGTDVDEHGCPLLASPAVDSDLDGIEDASDSCPGTESGATVDANGCSDAQLAAIDPGYNPAADPDGDGIPNSADECDDEPGLPEDSGCPPAADSSLDSSEESPVGAATDGGACSLIAR